MIVSVDKLNDHLMGNFDAIMSVLEGLELSNIRPNFSSNEIRCSREEGRNPTSLRIDTNTLYYACFSTGDRGNIYSLVMDRLGLDFRNTLIWVADILGLNKEEFKASTKKKRLPFGGYFKRIIKESGNPELNMKTYDESILNEYNNRYSLAFCRDGIGYDTQEFFKVGYDAVSNRITIPQWDVNGNLVGVMGRLNDPNAEKGERWLPVIRCPRSYTLFGYHQNYHNIQEKQVCFIGESEKFVMQLHAMGIRNSLAVGGCDISRVQAKYIKALMCKQIIICFDEGLSEKEVQRQAERIRLSMALFSNEVGYIYDRDGVILQKGSKASPSDLGLENFNKLVKDHIVWL